MNKLVLWSIKPAEKWIVGIRGNVAKTSVSKLPSGNDSWLYTVYGRNVSVKRKYILYKSWINRRILDRFQKLR
jgi:hypothetical protein